MGQKLPKLRPPGVRRPKPPPPPPKKKGFVCINCSKPITMYIYGLTKAWAHIDSKITPCDVKGLYTVASPKT